MNSNIGDNSNMYMGGGGSMHFSISGVRPIL